MKNLIGNCTVIILEAIYIFTYVIFIIIFRPVLHVYKFMTIEALTTIYLLSDTLYIATGSFLNRLLDTPVFLSFSSAVVNAFFVWVAIAETYIVKLSPFGCLYSVVYLWFEQEISSFSTLVQILPVFYYARDCIHSSPVFDVWKIK